MTFGLVFWILMLLWIVLGAWSWSGKEVPYGPWGGGLVLFVLLFLLGWGVFGAPIHR